MSSSIEVLGEPGSALTVVKTYTPKSLEQEYAAKFAELRQAHQRLLIAHVKRGRRRGAEVYMLRLVCGMLTSDNAEYRQAGKELAEEIGIGRSRRFAERYPVEKMRESVKKLLADIKDSKGLWSKVATKNRTSRQNAKWN